GLPAVGSSPTLGGAAGRPLPHCKADRPGDRTDTHPPSGYRGLCDHPLPTPHANTEALLVTTLVPAMDDPDPRPYREYRRGPPVHPRIRCDSVRHRYILPGPQDSGK